MKALNGFTLRKLVGEYVLMPVGSQIKSFQGVALMNDLSVFIWERLAQDVSREDLLQAILEEYDVDGATAAADLDEILSKMKDLGLLED